MTLGLIYTLAGIVIILVVGTKVTEALYLKRRLNYYRKRLRSETLSNDELRRIQTAIDFIKSQPVCSSNVRRLCEVVDREVGIRLSSSHNQERLWSLVR